MPIFVAWIWFDLIADARPCSSSFINSDWAAQLRTFQLKLVEIWHFDLC